MAEEPPQPERRSADRETSPIEEVSAVRMTLKRTDRRRLTVVERLPLLLLVPREHQRLAGTAEELGCALVANRIVRLDLRVEARRCFDEAEHLAHLLIAEAPMDRRGPGVLKFTTEAETGRSGEIHGRIVRATASLSVESSDVDEALPIEGSP